MAAAGGGAAAGGDMITDAELNRIELDETARFYEAEGDQTLIERTERAPATIDWAGLTRDLNAYAGIAN